MFSVFLALISGCALLGKGNGDKSFSRRGPDGEKPPQFVLLENIDWVDRKTSSSVDPKTLTTSRFSRFSNKKVYFSTLFNQFQKFKLLADDYSKDIQFCPSFHSLFLELKEERSSFSERVSKGYGGAKVQKILFSRPKKEVLALFPEMVLPLDDRGEGKSKSVYRMALEKKASNIQLHALLRQGIKVHAQKTLGELERLCHAGHGDSYFVFENLTLYMNRKRDFKNDSKALLSLLKTTVFANHFLLWALGFRPGQEGGSFSRGVEEEMILRLRADWSHQYLFQLGKRRLALLKDVEAIPGPHYGQVLFRP
ncbi:MAG: hypothetical protein OXB88_00280 [Bacteriovoracales bacterium]|nr:hypothetical protein [Bacteriovoracales bacterium]